MPLYIMYPAGSTCLDDSGMTFPNKISIDWSEWAKSQGGDYLGTRPYIWNNQPDQLLFQFSIEGARKAVMPLEETHPMYMYLRTE